MQAPHNLGSLAESVAQAVLQDRAPETVAGPLRTLFPAAAALRLSVLTGDRQVLASVASLLTPGRLALALHPRSASAAGAAIARRAPVYLTLESMAGSRPCYDFEGGAVLCVPILEPGSTDTSSADTAPCKGALLLSFPAGTQPDARHAGNLQLLAAVLAPRLGRAAAVLLEHCSLIIGGAESGAEAEAAEELTSQGSASSHVFVASSSAGEEEDEEGQEVEGESGTERHTRRPAQRGAMVEREGESTGQPGWAPGECRDDHRATDLPHSPGSPPPSVARLAAQATGEICEAESGRSVQATPGAAAATPAQRQQATGAALGSTRSAGAQSAGQGSAANQAGDEIEEAAPGSSRRSSGGLQPVSSPLSKGRAATHPASAVGGALATTGSVGSCSGSSSSYNLAEATPPQLLKESSSGSEGGEAALTQGLVGWHLLRFPHPQLEQRFAAWHASQLARIDETSLSLTAALQLALAARSSPGRLLASQGALLGLAAMAGPLALLVVLRMSRSAYVRHREALLALLYLGCAVNWLDAPRSSGGRVMAGLLLPEGLAALLQGVLAPLMLFSACQARLCLQGPLQLLLFVCHTWPLLTWSSDTSAFPVPLPCCLAFVLAVVAPLVLVHRLELRARHKFLACLPRFAQSG